MNVIELDSIQKSYDTTPVLRGLNLNVAESQVFGLLGPNGAGKSTLIHLMMGFLKPDAGTIQMLGTTPIAAHREIGYLPERLRYHTHCTGREYLHYIGRFGFERGQTLKDRVSELLTLVDLGEAADRRMKTYSKGMLQRIGIAQALISDPKLLLIDEPSSGLDPAGQVEMQDLLRELRSRGHSIFLCSHQLDEINAVCDRVGILVRGQIAAETDLAALPGTQGIVVTLKELPADDLDYGLRALDPSITRQDRQITIPVSTPHLQSKLLQLLIDEGFTVAALQPTLGTLRDVYLHVVSGKEIPVEMQSNTVPLLLDTLLAEEEQA